MLISGRTSGQPEVLEHEQSVGGLNGCFLLVIPLSSFSLWFVARRGVSDAGPRCRRLVPQLCSEATREKSVAREPDARRDLHHVDGAAVLSLPTRSPVKLWAVLFPCLCFERGPGQKKQPISFISTCRLS